MDIIELYLDENNIKYKKTYEEPNGYKENSYTRFYLYQNFNVERHYTIDIHNDNLVTFEYESEKYNYVSTSLFEEEGYIDFDKLFKIISEHMTKYIESDDDDESN